MKAKQQQHKPQQQQQKPQQPQQKQPTPPHKAGTNQNEFLYTAFTNGWKLEIYLFDGTVLRGKLSGYDNFDIIFLTEDGELYLLYKHYIKYIKPILK